METKELLEQLVKEVAAQNKMSAIVFLERYGMIDLDFVKDENDKKFVEEKINEFLTWLKQ